MQQLCFECAIRSSSAQLPHHGLRLRPAQPAARDHDGFIESLYHLLWVKNINGESCPEVRVPDVVIYKYRIPAYWYFTGSDGQLKWKNKTSIVNKKIYAEFTKGAKTPQDVVAYHISERVSADGDGSPETSITYFDLRTLHEFLFHQQKEDDGCLQQEVRVAEGAQPDDPGRRGRRRSACSSAASTSTASTRRACRCSSGAARTRAASTCRRSRRCAAPSSPTACRRCARRLPARRRSPSTTAHTPVSPQKFSPVAER